jgi:hypothetical protein
VSNGLHTQNKCFFVMYDRLWLLVLNATFNNISAISWRSVLLVVEETGDEWTTYTKQMLHFNI